jgi:hypothetical protein
MGNGDGFWAEEGYMRKYAASLHMKTVMMPLLAVILAACGASWEKLDGTWRCDAKATIAREQGIKNVSQQQVQDSQTQQVLNALDSVVITVNTKKKIITSNVSNPFLPPQDYAFEPSARKEDIILTSKAGPTLNFRLQDDKTALVWLPKGAAMVFRLDP